MGRRTIDLTGKTFGRLTVIDRYGSCIKPTKWSCQCQCGAPVVATGSNLTSGNTKSCGCLKKGRPAEHGKSGHPLHRVWVDMRHRCNCPTNTSASRYHDRGITVCPEWRESFQEFFTWALEAGWKKGLQIDRIDNNGSYEPVNCRFVDSATNASNRGRSSANTSGYVGVKQYAPGKYRSYIKSRGVSTNLGIFDSPEAAATARNGFITRNQLPHPIQKIKETVPHMVP